MTEATGVAAAPAPAGSAVGLFRPGKPGITVTRTSPLLLIGQAKFLWDTLVWEEGPTMWDGAGSFTIGKTGTYMGMGAVDRQAAATLPFYVEWQVNGVQLNRQRHNTSTATMSWSVPFLEHLQAGDVVELWCNSTNVTGNTYSGVKNRLSLVRIGPERWT